ncbi:DUF4349 domain-containing protein [Dyadobacter flavalbus]|uniref:DUF4349 domain-containing protein n=1 Tax=Dyadobacter flavalbus TaxID=2579942 RepID=A0A5M8R5B5_9BACT|nr:DUF4349 domain-containing protein [Dyadobacter flavalbus]KAA6441352.1 DUF4349 domain-containing protein [Dyadobacter flavalbus]
MKNLILLLFLFLLIVSCSNPNEQEELMSQVDFMQVPEPSSGKPVPKVVQQHAASKKLIRQGTIEFETTDAERTRSQIMAAVSKHHAYVSLDKQDKSADKISFMLIIRVPSAQFDTFLNSATEGVPYFDNRVIDVKDVTAEFVDTEITLKTKKQIESRYLQLLEKASNIKDILSIEKELGTIRTEIESTEGQLKLLTDEVQYSTLKIKFYKISSTPAVFSYQVKSSIVTGWENLLSALLAVINIWPFLLITIALYIAFSRRRKRKRLADAIGSL